MQSSSCLDLLVWIILPTIVQGFVLATPQCTHSLYATPGDISVRQEAWDQDVIGKLQAWAKDMEGTFGSTANPVPTAHVQRTPNRFTADMSFAVDDNSPTISSDSIDIRLVTVGQQPFLTISGPNHHQGVALDATTDVDTLEATLLPGNVLRIEADKKEPYSAGLRIPVIDKRA